MTNHKMDRAEDVLKQLAKYNGVQLPEDPLSRKSSAFLIISTSPTDDNLGGNEATAKGEESAKEPTNREEVEVLQSMVPEEPKDNVKDVQKYSLLDMFRTPRLRERSVLFCYVWWVLLPLSSLVLWSN